MCVIIFPSISISISLFNFLFTLSFHIWIVNLINILHEIHVLTRAKLPQTEQIVLQPSLHNA